MSRIPRIIALAIATSIVVALSSQGYAIATGTDEAAPVVYDAQATTSPAETADVTADAATSEEPATTEASSSQEASTQTADTPLTSALPQTATTQSQALPTLSDGLSVQGATRYVEVGGDRTITIKDAASGQLEISGGETGNGIVAGDTQIVLRSADDFEQDSHIHMEAVNVTVNLTFSGLKLRCDDVAPLEIVRDGGAHKVVLTLDGENTCKSSGSEEAGVSVPVGSTLTIKGTGTLYAEGDDNAAGIGGRNGKGYGTINIEGGDITAKGGDEAAGIGSGNESDEQSGTVNISGGIVTAIGREYGAGIGGGDQVLTGTTTISGGTVYAQGGDGGAGIGTGDDAHGTNGKITISGGEVHASGNSGSAAIGGGGTSSCGTIEISGGTVEATGSNNGAGIGGGNKSSGGTISISGGAQVTATGGDGAAGIGSGDGINGDDSYDAGWITISGDATKVTATGGNEAAGIGSGNESNEDNDCGTITINGGTVIAKGGSGTVSGGGAGIGGGDQCGIGAVTINGGTVEATGGSYAAGTGGGDDAEDGRIGTIRITGGNVTATSGEEAAGIGSGNESLAAGDIIISGGTVVATATENYGAGIGGGDSVSGCNVTISGGANVTATGGWHAAGIGSGDGDGDDSLFSGNVTITGAGTVVKATAGAEAAGIGGGNEGKNIGTFVISDGADVTATGGSSFLSVGGAGIGGGEDAEGGTVRISGDATKVTATGGGGSAGIGSGYDSGGGAGDVTIEGGTVLATGGQGGAGIGSGFDGWDNGSVTISGGRVTAIGNGTEAAGIGGGQDSEGCDVRISGGTVVATGGSVFACGIGGGKGEDMGSLVITGGSVLSNASDSSSIEKEYLGATPYDASGNRLHRCLVSLYWPTNDGYATSQLQDDVSLEGLTLQKADGTSIGSYGTNDIFTINSSSHKHDAWPSRNCGTVYLYLPNNDGDSVDLGRVVTSDGSTYVKETRTGPDGNGYYYVKASTTVSFECSPPTGQWMDEQVLYYGVPMALSKSVFTRPGYEFLGWSTTEGATTATWSDGQVVTGLGGEPTIKGSTTFYSVWKALYPDALISFTSSSTTMGTVDNALQTIQGGEGYVSRVNAVAKTGYHFVNWTVYGTDPAVVAGTDALLTRVQIKAQSWDTDHFNTTAFIANFAPNEYTVHFDANAAGEVSNVPAEQTMRYGEAQDLTSASTMTRAGCEFIGWAKTKDATSASYADGQSVKNLVDGEDGSDSVTLYAVWKINGTATMSYVSDDAGHGSTSPASVTVNRGDSERTAAGSKAIAAAGYHFDTSVGWTYVSSNGKTGKASSMPNLDVYAVDATARSTGLYESTTYTAHFAGNAYRVEFFEGDTDGTVKGTMDSQSMVYGTPKALTTCAYTRPGYTFLGWRSASGTFYADGAEISTPAAVAGNAVEVWLTAVWQALPDVAITYEVEGGHGTTTPSAEMVGATTPATGSTATPAAGYHFDYTKGWTYVDGTTTKCATAYQTITAPRVDEVAKASGAYVAMTFTAHMSANTYAVYFKENAIDVQGSTDAQALTYDRPATLNANAYIRRGYTFSGWNTAADGSGTSYSDAQEVSNLTTAQHGAVRLYAQWTPISYTVAFDANGGTGATASQTMSYGVKTALTSNAFSWPAHTFVGWSTRRGATTADYTDAQEVSNLSAIADDTVTLYAIWVELSPALISYNTADSTMGTCDPRMETVAADAKSGTAKGSTATS
ncbi:MAG: InlB B-repeat-containing protein, partial [Atopobiaceae bacterium]|nr:InlB B-repeat-containing protein [Atopobiaceae bacterium]